MAKRQSTQTDVINDCSLCCNAFKLPNDDYKLHCTTFCKDLEFPKVSSRVGTAKNCWMYRERKARA